MLNRLSSFLGITQTKESKPDESTYKPHPAEKREVIHSWDAVAEFKQRKIGEKSRKQILIIGITVALVFALIQDFLVILGLVSMVFGYYMLTQWEPEKMAYKITSHGVDYGDQLFGWGDLKYFFFVEKDGKTLLCIDSTTGLPGRLYLPIKKTETEKMKKILEEYLPFLEKEPQTFIDTAYKSVFGKIKLDK